MEGMGQILNACVIAIALGVVLKGLLQPKGKRQEGEETPMTGLLPKAFSLLKRSKREAVPLRILGSVALGLRERVFLLEAQDRRFLVAANRGRVSVLHVFGREPQAEPPKEKAEEAGAQDLAFPFPLPLEGAPSNGSRLKPFSEVVREVEKQYPFLKGLEGWER